MLKKTSFLTFLLLSFTPIFSQQRINWGELERVKGFTYQIEPIQKSEYYSFFQRKSFLFFTNYVSYHTNFQNAAFGKINKKIGSSSGKVIYTNTMNNLPIVFLSDYYKGQQILYYQIYSRECKPIGPAIELFAFTQTSGFREKGYFDIIQSPNKKFFCVEYFIPGKKAEGESMGYRIFDSNFKLLSNGTYLLPYTSQDAEIYQHLLTNSGEYFITTKVYDTSEKSIWRTKNQLEKIECHHIKKDTLIPILINTKGKKIHDIDLSSSDSNMVSITSLYGENERNNYGILGVLYARYNSKFEKVSDIGNVDFSFDFITQNWSQRAINRANNRMEKNGEKPELLNYEIRNTFPQNDGSIIHLLEQYYETISTYRDPKTGQIYTNTYYNYNDIIACKINLYGNFEWCITLPKTQSSINDGGYYSSFAATQNDSTILLFYNDYIGRDYKLMDNSGIYKSRKEKKVVTQIEINKKTGVSIKTPIFNQKEAQSIAVPKLFTSNPNSKELILYLRNRNKEKYGLLQF